MPRRNSNPAKRPVPVALCLIAMSFVVALLTAASADAAYYKMVACSANNGAPPHGISTNTASPQTPSGIFHIWNFCDGEGDDPPADGAFFRIMEHRAMPNSAGEGAYGNFYFDTPAYVHFKRAGGYTRQPGAFHDGWRSRFWVASCCSTAQILLQAPGDGAHPIFAPHLWPIPQLWDFNRFVFELQCVRPGRCDVSGDVMTDLNGLVFILSDDSDAQVAFTNAERPWMQGRWVRGLQHVNFDVSDLGSGIRNERMLVDNAQRWNWDHGGECNTSWTPTNLEWAKAYQPCPTGGPWGRWTPLETATLSDGAHTIKLCVEDFGQFQGLYATKGETCTSRMIRTDNTAPGAPSGLEVTSSNPNRYLDRFGARFSLPPNQGSPITKAHYSVVDASDRVVVQAKVVTGTNPTQLSGITGPAKAAEYRLRVWLEDEVGNVGPAATAPIPRDTTPPAAPQELSVVAPSATRASQAFDVRWRNLVDAGSPINAVHYEVVDPGGALIVPTRHVAADNPQAIESLDAPRDGGQSWLRLWLSDAEGNHGAPVKVPLAYNCVRSGVAGGSSVSAGLGPQASQAFAVNEGQGATLTGQLRGVGRLAGAPLCVFGRVVTQSARQFLGIAMTDSAGDFNFAVGAGPSREIGVIYRSGHRELTAGATLRTRVRPTFKLKKKVVRNKRVAVFTGTIPGPDNANVVVLLQVEDGKRRWRVFRRYRTREGGAFVMRYRFTQTNTPTTYRMRAEVPAQSGYAYEGGTSRVAPLTVRP
jgi:hypothetical protein